MLLICSSMTSVTSWSMTVALAPLMVVVTVTMGKSMSGIRWTPIPFRTKSPKKIIDRVTIRTVTGLRRAVSVIFMVYPSPPGRTRAG